jgi:hypothetical protein
MYLDKKLTGVIGLVISIVLAGCSNGSTTPSPGAPTNISGDYAGTVTDSVAGTGNATGTLAQTGSTAGGQIAFSPTSGEQTLNLSLAINSQNSIAGAMVVDYASGTTCTFNVSGSYSTSTNVLSGSYSAVTHCSGQTGTFSLTQQCTDTVASHVRRENIGGTTPC